MLSRNPAGAPGLRWRSSSPRGTSAGTRRSEETALPASASQSAAIAAGISQALVPFPKAGLLGTVTAGPEPKLQAGTDLQKLKTGGLCLVDHGRRGRSCVPTARSQRPNHQELAGELR